MFAIIISLAKQNGSEPWPPAPVSLLPLSSLLPKGHPGAPGSAVPAGRTSTGWVPREPQGPGAATGRFWCHSLATAAPGVGLGGVHGLGSVHGWCHPHPWPSAHLGFLPVQLSRAHRVCAAPPEMMDPHPAQPLSNPWIYPL